MSPSDTVSERVLLGRYELIREIARGGMGVVHLGRQLHLDREVAIKVLRPEARPSRRLTERFKREALIAKRLTHPNTVRIYDYGETEAGDLVLVMEYLEGTTLAEYVARSGPLPIDRVARIAKQVLKSLIEAHGHGIVHRDIKPHNLMLCEQLGERDLVKVLDFGVARLRDAAQTFDTASGVLVGTPYYLSPEQALSQPVDARSDIYSLGVTLLELLTGERPFDGDSPVAVALQHASQLPVEVPTQLKTTRLGRVIARAVQKWPADRYPSAQAMLDDLEGGPATRAEPTPVGQGRQRATLAESLVSTDETLSDSSRASAVSTPDPTATFPESGTAPSRSALRPVRPSPKRGPARGGVWLLGLALAVVAFGAGAYLLWWPTPSSETPPERAAVGRLTERRLTANPPERLILGATLSHDGTRVAYSDAQGFWVVRVDDGVPELVPVGTADSGALPEGVLAVPLSWFPSGDRILMGLFGQDVATSLAVMDLTSGDLRAIAAEVPGVRDFQGGIVSPDGQRIAYSTNHGVSVMSVDGGDGTPILRSERLIPGGWSPDGRYLAVVSGLFGGESAIIVVAADGSSSRRLVAGQRLEVLVCGSSVAWLGPSRLLYTAVPESPGLGQTELWETSTTTSGSETERRLFVWPDTVCLSSGVHGGRLLFNKVEHQRDVYVAPLNADGDAMGTAQRLTLDDREDLVGPWVDDQRVSLSSNRAGDWDVYVQALGDERASLWVGGDTHDVPAERDPDGRLMFWRSPQGAARTASWCHLMRRGADGSDTLVARVSETRSCFQTSFPYARMPFHVECAERRCVLGEKRREMDLWSVIDWRTGQIEPPFYRETTVTGASWALSPDGETIVTVQSATAELEFVPVDTPERRRTVVVQPTGAVQFVAFHPGGDRLFITGMGFGEEPYGLLSCDLQGQCQMLWSHENAWINRAIPSPDGEHVAFGLLTFDTDLWLLEGF